jgi:class 3 adenylate cyclase
MWQIIINGPGYFDTPYDLPEGATSLGRADENDIVLSGDLVSRRHARIHLQGEGLTLEDLNSRNGTRVNGEPRTGATPLKLGDTITVGENTLSLRRPGAVETAATELVDASSHGLRRVGEGNTDIGPAVLFSKDIKEKSVLRALDNVLPFEPGEGFFSALSAQAQAQTQVPYPSLLLLFKTAELLSRAPSLTSFLEETAERLIQWVNATTAVVLLRQPGGSMGPAAVRHRGELAQGEVPISAAIVGAALEQGAALAVADVRDDVRFANRESVILYGLGRVMCVPIGEGVPFDGVLYLNMPAGGDSDLEGVLDLCTAVAHLIHSGVEKFTLRSRGADETSVRRVLARTFPPDLAERRMQNVRLSQQAPWEERAVSALRVELPQLSTVLEQPPERAGELLRDFLGHMAAVVFSFEGVVLQRTGEGLEAIFGAVDTQDDHAVRAVRAALALRVDWARYLSRQSQWGSLPLRVGVASGRALVGTLGSEAWMDFTAVGEAVSVCQYLTETALPGQVLMTGKTLASVGARFEVTPLGPRALRPGMEKVPTFEVVEEDVLQNTEPGVT